MEMKKCPMCSIIKPLSEYHKLKDGTQCYCKDCRSEICKKYYQKNKDSILEKQRNKKEKIKKYQKEYYKKHREKLKNRQRQYYINNREAKVEYSRNYVKKHKEQVLGYKYKYVEKVKNTPHYKIRMRLTKRINAALHAKNGKKAYKSIQLLGCSIKDLKVYLEDRFSDGMTWDNYSYDGWHIDHIKPCASFDLTDPEQQKECFHYTNLQPLWAKDNLSKGAKPQ